MTHKERDPNGNALCIFCAWNRFWGRRLIALGEWLLS